MFCHPVMHNIFTGILFTMIGLFFLACNDAAVTEPIDNPNQVRPIILLQRTMNNVTGQILNGIQVTLKNSRDEAIAIDSGKVLVNEQEMSPPKWYLLGTQRDYYYLNMPVTSDAEYEFTVISSEGERASAWVRAPRHSLDQIIIPEEQNGAKDLVVHWQEIDYEYPQYVIINRMDGLGNYLESNEQLLYVRYPYKGKFTVNSRYLNVQDESTGNYNEHRVYVVSENKGALSEGFLEGGSIKCQLRVYQDFHVYKN